MYLPHPLKDRPGAGLAGADTRPVTWEGLVPSFITVVRDVMAFQIFMSETVQYQGSGQAPGHFIGIRMG
jgi:hypothetical protein